MAPTVRRCARRSSCWRSVSPGRTGISRNSKAASTAHRLAAARTHGFGYDPMFLPDGHERTFGEMTRRREARPAAVRPGLSHRARAFLKLAHGLPEPESLHLSSDGSRAKAVIAGAISMHADESAFGVYVHWPFCLSKCPYCDFNSHVRHAAIDEARYVRAFAAEIAATAARVPGPRGLDDLLRRRHALADAAGDRRRDPRRHRQALDGRAAMSRSRSKPTRPASRRRASAAIARPASTACRSACRRSTIARSRSSAALHTAREALDAVAVARAIFERYSFDLIYARPGQTPQAWAAELKRAIAEAAEHLSLYQLTIEPDTPFAALHAAGKLVVPDEDYARALYDATQEICAAAGLAGLRDFQPRAARRRVPAQSRLLARARICRHRPRRAWPSRHRRRAPRHRHREAAGGLADAGRALGHGVVTDDDAAAPARWPTNSC